MQKLTPFLGHLKKVRPLLGVSFFARSSITRATWHSGHSIKGSLDSLPVGYATACARMELPPRSYLLTNALEASDMCDMATLTQGRRGGRRAVAGGGGGGKELGKEESGAGEGGGSNG